MTPVRPTHESDRSFRNMTLKQALLRLVLRLLGPPVNAGYNMFFLLRMGILLLERDINREAGHDDQQNSVQIIQTGAAWVDFCDRLKGAGEFITRDSAVAGVQVTDLDRAEGLRYLSRLVRGGVESFMDCWDPAYPVLRPLPYNVKLGADNPDNLYLYGTISGRYTYRIRGHRGTVTYLSFACYAGSRPGEGSTTPGIINSSQLKLDPDGCFEIIASCSPPLDSVINWLPMEPSTTRLVVRQTFLDRSAECEARLTMERIHDASGIAGEPFKASGSKAETVDKRPALPASDVVAGLAGSALFINGAAMQFLNWSNMFALKARNKFMVLDNDSYMTAWADPAIYFYHGYWQLEADEALIIQMTPPDCPYWNFQLNNWWMESMDSENFRVHVNKRTAVIGPDGKSVCIVVAHQDPHMSGITYLETAHHTHGTMALRWVLAKEHPEPHCRVVKDSAQT